MKLFYCANKYWFGFNITEDLHFIKHWNVICTCSITRYRHPRAYPVSGLFFCSRLHKFLTCLCFVKIERIIPWSHISKVSLFRRNNQWHISKISYPQPSLYLQFRQNTHTFFPNCASFNSITHTTKMTSELGKIIYNQEFEPQTV